MFRWIKEALQGSATPRPTSARPQQRSQTLNLEELSARDLPSSHMLGAGFGNLMSLRQAASSGNTTALVKTSSNSSSSSSSTSSSSEHGQCGGFGDAAFTASLSDAAGATATASYNASKNALKITVTGATASTTLDVQLDGVSIGSLTTDSSGNGSVTLKNLTAAVTASTAITVGDLTGTFTQNKFTAKLAGDSTSVTGSAGYNALKHSLNVYFTGATAKATYNVLVDGTSVGTLTTTKAGKGVFHLDLSTLDIKSGSVITITDSTNATILTGTFA